MAVNAFISFFDKADGESVQKGKEKWIEIQGWDWEVEAETSWTKGGGASVGKPNPGKMNWEHYFDKSSCTLLQYICSGAAFDTVELRMFKGTGQAVQTGPNTQFFTMLMKGAFITKVTNSATEEGNVLQKVEMVFKEVTIKYRPQEDPPKGSKSSGAGQLGSEISYNWDIPGGKVT